MCSNIQDDENMRILKNLNQLQDPVLVMTSSADSAHDEAELHFLFQGFFGLWETKEKDKREFLR